MGGWGGQLHFVYRRASKNILGALSKVSLFTFATILPIGYLRAFFTDSFDDFHGALPTEEGLSHALYHLNPHIPTP